MGSVKKTITECVEIVGSHLPVLQESVFLDRHFKIRLLRIFLDYRLSAMERSRDFWFIILIFVDCL